MSDKKTEGRFDDNPIIEHLKTVNLGSSNIDLRTTWRLPFYLNAVTIAFTDGANPPVEQLTSAIIVVDIFVLDLRTNARVKIKSQSLAIGTGHFEYAPLAGRRVISAHESLLVEADANTNNEIAFVKISGERTFA